MASTNKLIRSLYRSLLRLSTKFDTHPLSKSIIFRKQLTPTHLNSVSVYYTYVLDHILGGSDVMFYPVHKRDHVSLKSIVQSEFRARNTQVVTSDRIDAAFAYLRKFSSIWKEYQNFGIEIDPHDEQDIDNDDNDSHAEIRNHNKEDVAVGSETSIDSTTSDASDINEDVDAWRLEEKEEFFEAHKFMNDTPVLLADKGIVPGTILVAHPMVLGSMKQAVVLVLHHSEDITYGIIINKPTEFSFAKSAIGLPDDVLSPFKDNAVNFGGLIRRLNVIHPYAEIGGNQVPLCSQDGQALYWSADIDKLKEFAEANPECKRNIHFFAGCCTWTKEDLSQQIKQGFWIPVASYTNKIYFLASKEERPDAANRYDESNSNDDAFDMLEPPSNSDQSTGANSLESNHKGSTNILEQIEFNEENHEEMALPVSTWLWIMSQVSPTCQEIYLMPTWVDSSSVDSADMN